MTTSAAFAGPLLRPMVMVGLERDEIFLQSSKASSGPATGARMLPRADGLLQLKVRRCCLLIEARRARDLCQCKKGSLIEEELHRVTHDLMRAENEARQ